MKLWPLVVISGLLVSMVVNFAFLYLALSGDTASIEARPYERGQEFEVDVAAMRLAERTGVDFSLVNSGQETCLRLSRGSNPSLIVESLRVTLRRPNRPASDVYRDFLEVGREQNEFCLGVALEFGLWLAEIRLDGESGIMLLKRREVIAG